MSNRVSITASKRYAIPRAAETVSISPIRNIFPLGLNGDISLYRLIFNIGPPANVGDVYIPSYATGLVGQFFSGSWRSVISTGNIGTLPLSSPTVYDTTGGISYSSLGDNYGFIAIGFFVAPTTGTYTFYTSSDDGSGVWVGDIAAADTGRTTANAVVNNGMGGGQGNTKRSGTIDLIANKTYPIRIVHEEGDGGDNLTFSWAGPGIAETTSLASYFYYSTDYDYTYFAGGSIDSDATQSTIITSDSDYVTLANISLGIISTTEQISINKKLPREVNTVTSGPAQIWY